MYCYIEPTDYVFSNILVLGDRPDYVDTANSTQGRAETYKMHAAARDVMAARRVRGRVRRAVGTARGRVRGRASLSEVR